MKYVLEDASMWSKSHSERYGMRSARGNESRALGGSKEASHDRNTLYSNYVKMVHTRFAKFCIHQSAILFLSEPLLSLVNLNVNIYIISNRIKGGGLEGINII